MKDFNKSVSNTNGFFSFSSKFDKHLIRALISLNLFVFTVLFENILDIPKLLKYVFSFYAISVFVIYSYKGKSRVKGSRSQELTITIFSLISLYLLLTSFRFEFFFLQELFAEQFYFLPYLTPVILLKVSFSLNLFRLLIKWSYYFLPVAIFVEIYVIFNALSTDDYPFNVIGIYTVSLLPMILLGLYDFHGKKYSIHLLLIYFLLFAFITASLGRRGETIEILFMLGWAFWIRFRSSIISIKRKLSIFVLGFLLIIGGGIFVTENKEDIFLFQRGFNQNAFNESRGETIEMFLLDFGKRPMDWFTGRGLNGMVQKFDRGDKGKSRSIEIGYFNALLKGGLLYLVPMILLLLMAFYKGYFKSYNDLAKLLSGLAFWQILYMVSFGLPNFNFSYTFLWIAVSALLNKEFRGLSNSQLHEIMNLKK